MQNYTSIPPLDFSFRESDLAKQIGVRRTKIVELRIKLLKRGEDWDKRGVTIGYTKEGAKKIIKEFLPPHLTIEPVPFDETDIVEAKVIRANYPNRHVVLASTNGHEPFLIKVHDSTNFKPGMTIKSRKVPGEVLPLIVGRCPRYPGRW